jgi:hypothetical protein
LKTEAEAEASQVPIKVAAHVTTPGTPAGISMAGTAVTTTKREIVGLVSWK